MLIKQIIKIKLNYRKMLRLYMACFNNYIKIVKLLLKQNNIDINKADNDDLTPLPKDAALIYYLSQWSHRNY